MARIRSWECELLRLLQKILEVLDCFREFELTSFRFQWTERSPLISTNTSLFLLSTPLVDSQQRTGDLHKTTFVEFAVLCSSFIEEHC